LNSEIEGLWLKESWF